jgi:L-seryl-tRNA(Ser) seleniumtransferase
MPDDPEARHLLLRRIPAVDQILQQPPVADWVKRTSRSFVVAEIQALLRQLRSGILADTHPPEAPVEPGRIAAELGERLRRRLEPALKAVVNATGVILHTNLGRAPLSSDAQESLSAGSARYTNLEYDIAEGTRSHRDRLVEGILDELLGSEAATVVNNNAAAVFLILNTLAFGKEVVVSRGELVEIGGSFRIPDILAQSGARLREVGTTNKTRLRDYEAAIGPDTALILRVHPSNYRIRGFTERPGLGDLVELAHRHQLPLVEDLGSGCLARLEPLGIEGEPMPQDSLAAGADLVCFSADKLLGGPQAGIVAGARRHVDRIKTNPLMRTYRVGKLVYGALGATLTSYLAGRAMADIPVLKMLSMTQAQIRRKSGRFLRKLRARLTVEARCELVEGSSVVGGGSCPDISLATVLVALASDRVSPSTIERRLRGQAPPIIIRLENDRALLDLRTVFPSQESTLLHGIVQALS